MARHMLTKVRGRFTEFSGHDRGRRDAPRTLGSTSRSKTGSVQTNYEQRDDHLKSADFFEVEEHPTMSFRSTAVRHTGGTNFELDGDLTIKDITKPVTLDWRVPGRRPGPVR